MFLVCIVLQTILMTDQTKTLKCPEELEVGLFSFSTCSESSVLWHGEEVALRDDDGSQSQNAHHNQVDEAGLRRAVEGVV